MDKLTFNLYKYTFNIQTNGTQKIKIIRAIQTTKHEFYSISG